MNEPGTLTSIDPRGTPDYIQDGPEHLVFKDACNARLLIRGSRSPLRSQRTRPQEEQKEQQEEKEEKQEKQEEQKMQE